MSQQQVFEYRLPNGKAGYFTTDDIEGMSMPEFLYYKDYLVNVRDVTRYDTAVYEKVVVTSQHVHQLFRKGIGQQDKFATSDNAFVKNEFHTNMPRQGEVPAGGLWILYDVAAPKAFTAGKPTTVGASGQITNAKATFVASNDPALNLEAWINQMKLKYTEGDSEDGIIRGLLKDFPANTGQSGYLGSSVGGVAQNAMIPNVSLRSPRILQAGQDFTAILQPLCDFDLTTANGIDQMVTQKVELKTIELVKLAS